MLVLLTIVLQQDTALSGTRIILALVLVVLASSLALGICVGLMRRVQSISPPDDPRNRNDPRMNANENE